jgi:uncharacterized membrane protein
MYKKRKLPLNFNTFVRFMFKRNLDIFGILILCLILILFILAFPIDIIRIAIGLLFLLFFPGYMLVAALFHRKESISVFERVVLSFGMSFAVVSFLGLILNYTPGGIGLYSILISISIFVFIIALIAIIRRQKLPEEEQYEVVFLSRLFHSKHHDNQSIVPSTKRDFAKSTNILNKYLNIILVIAIIAVVAVLIYVVTETKTGELFSEFYILGIDGKADNYPTSIQFGDNATVILGIVNHEQKTTTYNFKVSIDNSIITEQENIIIANNQKWEQQISFMPTKIGENQKTEFTLYKNEDSFPYLTLHFWISIK